MRTYVQVDMQILVLSLATVFLWYFVSFSMKQCIGVDLKSLLQYLALYFSIVLLFLFCCGVRRGPVVVVRGFRSAGPIDFQSLAALSPYTVYIILYSLHKNKENSLTIYVQVVISGFRTS